MENLIEEKEETQVIQNPSIEGRFRLRQDRDGMTTANMPKKKDNQEQRKGNTKNPLHRADIVCNSVHLDRS